MNIISILFPKRNISWLKFFEIYDIQDSMKMEF